MNGYDELQVGRTLLDGSIFVTIVGILLRLGQPENNRTSVPITLMGEHTPEPSLTAPSSDKSHDAIKGRFSQRASTQNTSKTAKTEGLLAKSTTDNQKSEFRSWLLISSITFFGMILSVLLLGNPETRWQELITVLNGLFTAALFAVLSSLLGALITLISSKIVMGTFATFPTAIAATFFGSCFGWGLGYVLGYSIAVAANVTGSRIDLTVVGIICVLAALPFVIWIFTKILRATDGRRPNAQQSAFILLAQAIFALAIALIVDLVGWI